MDNIDISGNCNFHDQTLLKKLKNHELLFYLQHEKPEILKKESNN